MKIFLEIDIKPFGKRDSYKPYRGLYTPKGRRNKRCRIEVDSNMTLLGQVGAFLHEIGHLISDIWLGSAHLQNKKAEEIEHKFCEPLEKKGTAIFKKFLGLLE